MLYAQLKRRDMTQAPEEGQDWCTESIIEHIQNINPLVLLVVRGEPAPSGQARSLVITEASASGGVRTAASRIVAQVPHILLDEPTSAHKHKTSAS